MPVFRKCLIPHIFKLPGKQKSFGENTVKVWGVLLSLCLFYAVKCVFAISICHLMLITRQNISDNSLFIGCLVLCFCGDQNVLISQPLQQEFVAPRLSKLLSVALDNNAIQFQGRPSLPFLIRPRGVLHAGLGVQGISTTGTADSEGQEGQTRRRAAMPILV